MMPLRIKTNDKILIVAPHPDDESIGTGGILARYSSQCTVIVVTDGGKASEKIHSSVMRKIRKEEFLREMESAGIKQYKMIDQQDGSVYQNQESFTSVEFNGFTKCFLPSKFDGHPDHTFSLIYVVQEIIKQKIENMEIYQYEVHKPLHEPTNYLDITDVIDRKIELIRIHKSQCDIRDYAGQAKALALYRAYQEKAPGRYYEAYEKIDVKTYSSNREIKKEYLWSAYRWKNNLLMRWMNLKFNGRGTEKYFQKHDIQSISIYGYGKIGRLLYSELKNTKVKVEYYLDRRAACFHDAEIPVFTPNRFHGKVDAVVLTVSSESVKEIVKSNGYQNVLLLNDILDNLYRNGINL